MLYWGERFTISVPFREGHSPSPDLQLGTEDRLLHNHDLFCFILLTFDSHFVPPEI